MGAGRGGSSPGQASRARSAEGLGQGRGKPASILSFAQNPAKAQTRKLCTRLVLLVLQSLLTTEQSGARPWGPVRVRAKWLQPWPTL